MIKFINTTPADVNTGEYLFSLGNEHYPLCIASKRESQAVDGNRMIELGLSPRSGSKHAGVGIHNGLDYKVLLHDTPIVVLDPHDVPLDAAPRASKFGGEGRWSA